MIAECIKDMVQGLMKIRTEADEAKKVRMKRAVAMSGGNYVGEKRELDVEKGRSRENV